jgi:hypothetical protein
MQFSLCLIYWINEWIFFDLLILRNDALLVSCLSCYDSCHLAVKLLHVDVYREDWYYKTSLFSYRLWNIAYLNECGKPSLNIRCFVLEIFFFFLIKRKKENEISTSESRNHFSPYSEWTVEIPFINRGKLTTRSGAEAPQAPRFSQKK